MNSSENKVASSPLSVTAWFGDAREVLSCSRTDWLILTSSPLTGPVLARKLREAETRGTVEIDEQGRDVVLITFTPSAEAPVENREASQLVGSGSFVRLRNLGLGGEPVDEIVCAKVDELLGGNPAPMAELEARIKAHTHPDGEVIEMALCEAGRLMLRPNVLYRFTVRDGCKACADAAAPYSPNGPSEPRGGQAKQQDGA